MNPAQLQAAINELVNTAVNSGQCPPGQAYLVVSLSAQEIFWQMKKMEESKPAIIAVRGNLPPGANGGGR